jgi:hypothetical protein
MSKRALNGHWPQPRRAEASAFVLSQCAVRDLNPEPADSDYSLVGSCRYPAVETIASQRDLRFLTIGNLWLVVAICGQKMWRKVCVMATKAPDSGERMIFKSYPKDDEPRTLRVSSQRKTAILTIGRLWLIVASCGQKMWRKVCVVATSHLPGARGAVGSAGLFRMRPVSR